MVSNVKQRIDCGVEDMNSENTEVVSEPDLDSTSKNLSFNEK